MKQYIENMEDEIRCDYLVSSQMKQVWNIQLNLAVKLLEVCKKYGLRIVADSGTALGTIRHQGFIPWDDDMDFRMPRKDYDKLLEIASTEFKSPYFFQTCYSDKGVFFSFAKLRCDNTAMILELDLYSGAKYHKGIDIDIFPDDYLPDTERAINELLKRKRVVFNYINLRNSNRYLLLPARFLGFLKNAMILKHKAFWSDKKLMRDIDSELRRHDNRDKNQMGLLAFMYYFRPRCVINSRLYDNIIYAPFESIKMPVFANYDELLTTEYGDWHKLVKGNCSHKVVVIDTERSYKSFENQVRLPFKKLYIESLRGMLSRFRYNSNSI